MAGYCNRRALSQKQTCELLGKMQYCCFTSHYLLTSRRSTSCCCCCFYLCISPGLVQFRDGEKNLQALIFLFGCGTSSKNANDTDHYVEVGEWKQNSAVQGKGGPADQAYFFNTTIRSQQNAGGLGGMEAKLTKIGIHNK